MAEHDQPAGNGPAPGEPGVDRRRFLGGAAACGVAGSGGAGRADPPPRPAPGGQGMNPRLFSFVGGAAGPWAVTSVKAVAGDPLAAVARLDVVNADAPAPAGGAGWVLRSVTSNERYATRAEKDKLVARQAGLGRPGATHAALIPIRKNAKWWALTQDERRAVFEDQSRHVTTGLKYLPAVARRLHHCRDLGAGEPFDFLTLFDYAAADAAAFDDMVAELRATEEWKYVDREVDIRMTRADR